MNLEQFFTRLKNAAASLSAGQVMTLALSFVAVVALTIGSAYYLNIPTYGVLFSDLDPESAASIVGRLKSDKILYTLDSGSRTIRVPVNRVDELRLQYAANGLAGSGHVGFEIFDRTSFGVTDFQEHVNLQRALEGELARTISTISEIAGARVHIAMPQQSLFIGREQQTKASVVLKLRSNKQLRPDTVAAISNLVSAGVESLRPESVVIIDNFGRPLSKPTDPDQQSQGVPLERQQAIERDLSNRLLAMLEPIVGSGHARVNVSARLNPDTAEETEERWGPQGVIRSRQSVSQGTGPVPGSGVPGVVLDGTVAGGVAGARANLPPPAAAAEDGKDPAENGPKAAGLVAGAPLMNSKSAETANYEVNRLTRHSVKPRGEVMRLSVAVVLDENRPGAAPAESAPAGSAPAVTPSRAWGAPDIQKIHDVVAAAVGFDTERGDQLTVETIAFEEAPIEQVIEPGLWQRISPQVFEALRIFGIVALAAFAIFGVIRPMMKGSFGGGAAAAGGVRRLAGTAVGGVGPGGQPRTVQDLEAEMDAQLNVPDALRVPALTRRMATLTQKEPENAARLLRTWLTEDR